MICKKVMGKKTGQATLCILMLYTKPNWSLKDLKPSFNSVYDGLSPKLVYMQSTQEMSNKWAEHFLIQQVLTMGVQTLLMPMSTVHYLMFQGFLNLRFLILSVWSQTLITTCQNCPRALNVSSLTLLLLLVSSPQPAVHFSYSVYSQVALICPY